MRELQARISPEGSRQLPRSSLLARALIFSLRPTAATPDAPGRRACLGFTGQEDERGPSWGGIVLHVSSCDSHAFRALLPRHPSEHSQASCSKVNTAGVSYEGEIP